MIPKILHQIWLGPTIPPKVQEYIESIRVCYEPRGWTMRLWRDADAMELPQECQEKMARCPHPIAASDVMRYYIIAKCGGVYLDVDMEATPSFLDDTVTEEADLFTVYPGGSLYTNNCLFGANAGHEFFQKVSELCVGGGPTMPTSGSVFFGVMCNRYKRFGKPCFYVREGVHFVHHTELKWDDEMDAAQIQ